MPDDPPGQAGDTVAAPSLSTGDLAMYELQKPFVEPMLRMCRLTNTALDVLFYDVGVLMVALLARGKMVDTGLAAASSSAPHALQSLDLSALTNPSGSVIVVDANAAPYVRPPFRAMDAFFDYANGPTVPACTPSPSPGSAAPRSARWHLRGISRRRWASRWPRSYRATASLMSFRRRSAAGSDSRCTARCRPRRRIFWHALRRRSR